MRIRAVGLSEGDLLHVVYTERDDIRRIISVRLANRKVKNGMARTVRLSLSEIKKRGTSRNRSKIAATTAADVRRHRIEDGDKDVVPSVDRLQPRPATIRHRLGMTQRQFAAAIGVPLATLRNWEQSRAEPDPAARALLRILAREPIAALRALGKSKAA